MLKQRKGQKITTNMRQSTNICSDIVDNIVDKLVDEAEEDRLFFEEIEKCKEYIREVQNEIGYVWQTPTPSSDPYIHEDNPSFVSHNLLQSKLSSIKLLRPETSIIKKRASSHLSRKSTLRYSYESKASTKSISQWGQYKFSLLKKENESKLKDRNKDKKSYFVKLHDKKEDEQQNEEEDKFIREYLSLGKNGEPEQKKRKYRKMKYVQKKKLSLPDDGSIPMLVEMNVNITQEDSQKHLPLEKAKKSLSIKYMQVTQNNNMPTINHRSRQKLFNPSKNNENTYAKGKLNLKNKEKMRLNINDYQKKKNQIIINDWDVFNHIIDFPPSVEAVSTKGKHYSKMNITIDRNNLEQARKSSLHIYIPQY